LTVRAANLQAAFMEANPDAFSDGGAGAAAERYLATQQPPVIDISGAGATYTDAQTAAYRASLGDFDPSPPVLDPSPANIEAPSAPLENPSGPVDDGVYNE
jgi:hypothetical protein